MHLPLVTCPDPEAIFAWREGRPISLREFLGDVQRVASAMPAGMHVLNTCRDRYHFAVGFAAAVASARTSFLPSTRTPEMVQQLRDRASDLFCLSDGPCELDLPHMAYPRTGGQPPAVAPDMPMIPADRVVAQVFTSGSTGSPIPHSKTWGALVRCVQTGKCQLALQAPGMQARVTLIGTVPPQHMYGFESTLLMAFHGDVALGAAHPFYPADIAAALASVPAPRLLVSTPVHLRALLSADVCVPQVAAVLCATAPLAVELARDVEARLQAPLLEIYGSTETGQIATRRTALTDAWQLFADVRIGAGADGITYAAGGHVPVPTPIQDVIEVLDGQHFRLHGRSADLVNIAGKRSSLAYLSHQLCAIPGVEDGAFFMPDETAEGVARLMAFAVAPGLTPDALRTALRQRIDPAFMPRPLVLVEALPRNATGKLPRAALAALHATVTDPS